MSWTPIETESQLPALHTRETISLDFKREGSSDSYEWAKDIASFANAQGGSIVVGGAGGDNLEKWSPLSRSEAQTVARTVDIAVRDRCRPTPFFGIQELKQDEGLIVVVNVWPFPGQPVGVRILDGELSCGTARSRPPEVFYFPIRVGTHTKAISPEQLAMFFDAKTRRVALLLSTAVEQEVLVFSTRHRLADNASWMQGVTLESVDLLGNAVTILVPLDGGKKEHVTLPLDAIESACRGPNGLQIYLRGTVKPVEWLQEVSGLAQLRCFYDPLG